LTSSSICKPSYRTATTPAVTPDDWIIVSSRHHRCVKPTRSGSKDCCATRDCEREESPVNADWRDRYERAVALAQRAGQRALSYFAGDFQVELKDDQSPVTIADRESEQLLRTTLKAAFPNDGFLGEEYGDEPGTSGFRWIIDPIDGTRNFVRAI